MKNYEEGQPAMATKAVRAAFERLLGLAPGSVEASEAHERAFQKSLTRAWRYCAEWQREEAVGEVEDAA